MLPLRNRSIKGETPFAFPEALQLYDAGGEADLPCLRGELPSPAAAAIVVILHIHNSAGIPIIEGRAHLAAGEHSIVFADLRPIGIDAYAHKSPAERTQIAARIWTRRAYGTLHLQR